MKPQRTKEECQERLNELTNMEVDNLQAEGRVYHYPYCWRDHLPCALKRLAMYERATIRLLKQKRLLERKVEYWQEVGR